MGRANIYLSDDLEQRVRAAKLPVSEICQQALLQAVEAAEGSAAPFGSTTSDSFRTGWTTGAEWAAGADTATLLRLLRDSQLPEIPREQLPESWFSWSDEQTLAWEAGFVEAARSAIRSALAADLPTPALPARTPAAPAAAGPVRLDKPGSGEELSGDVLQQAADGDSDRPLGDSSGSFVGKDRDGRRVAFDPHAALHAGKSPLFAVLGPADQRARLTLSIGQDAASRGAAVVVVDVSGALAPRAKGLGRNVRIVRG